MKASLKMAFHMARGFNSHIILFMTVTGRLVLSMASVFNTQNTKLSKESSLKVKRMVLEC